MNTAKDDAEQKELFTWVKASEELPEFYDNYERHFRVDGKKADGMFDLLQGEKVFEQKIFLGYLRIYENQFYRIEWLKPISAAQDIQSDAAPEKNKMSKAAFETEDEANEAALEATHELSQSPKYEKFECENCDGVGWWEGGETLKTTCVCCKGTGFIWVPKEKPIQKGDAAPDGLEKENEELKEKVKELQRDYMAVQELAQNNEFRKSLYT